MLKRKILTYTTYTDNDMKKINSNDILGDSAKTQMPNLDWNNKWVAVDGKIPSLKTFYDAVASEDEEKALNIIYWNGEKTAPDETKVDADGNILIYTAEELNYIATTASSGKSYKIADGIDVMILQPEASVDAETLMGLTDYNAVKTYLTETVTATAWSTSTSDPKKVLSSFDGNGVEIYGLYAVNSNSAGLFPGVDQGTVFENFALRNSYIESGRRIGVIGAYCAGDTVGTVAVKNVEVSNCYIVNTSTTESHFGEMGVLLGRTTKDYVSVDNCLIYGNYNYATGLDKQIPLYAGAASGATSTITNSVILGTEPYPTNAVNSHTHGADSFENVYTDQEIPTGKSYTTYTDNDIKKINPTEILGNNAKTEMPNLDWENIWVAVDGKLPALKLFYNEASSEGDGNEGDEPQEPTPEEIKDCAQNIIYWDNTKTDSKLNDNGEKGTADDPIIIDNAEELNQIAVYTAHAASTEKHYKIADGIDAIILQPQSVVDAMGGAGKLMNLSSAAEVNGYFADMISAGYTPANWIKYNSNQFNGSVDGNGVKIYGMYAVATTGDESAGLFPTIDAGGTAENTSVETDFAGVYYKDIAIRNSYISSTRRMGALTGISYGTNYGAKVNGTVTVDGIEVSNCYMRATGTHDKEKGVLVGNFGSDLVNINNCLVYNIDASWDKNGTVVPLTLIATTASIIDDQNNSNENTFKNSIVLGVSPTPQSDESKFSKAENVENVYTDYDISALVSKYSYTDSDMKKLTGTTAEEMGNQIGTALDTGKWLNVTGGMPTLCAFHDALVVVSSTDTKHTLKCECGIECIESAHVYDKNYKCSLCDYQHEHSMVDVNVQADADCVNGGIMNTKCENCDYTSTREITSSGHTFGEVINATAGDCKTEATVAHKHCSVCNLDFAADADIHSDEPLEHIGTGYTGRHNWVAQTPVTSVCGGVEQIEYFKCSVCEVYMVYGVMTDTAPTTDGHSLIRVKANEPTCTGNGNIEYFDCQNCEKYFTSETGEVEIAYEDTQISAINHKNNVHHTKKDADCLNDGNIEYWYCPDCDKNYSDEACTTVVDNVTEAAHGHSFSEVTSATSGDCKTDGTVAYKTCTVCQNNYAENAQTNETQALEDISTGVKGEHNWVAQTPISSECSAVDDIAYDKCSICEKYRIGDQISDTILTAKGHNIEAVAEVAATCTENGVEAHSKCTACGKLFQNYLEVTEDELVISAVGHTVSKVDEVSATTEKDGTKAHYACGECDKLFLDSEGKTETELKDLVIAKLQKVEEESTDDQKPTETAKPDESKPTETVKPEVDKNEQSPATKGESVAVAAALVVSVIAAGFVIIRKFKKV